jgi:hypothetical protein
MEKGIGKELPDEEFSPHQHGDQAKNQIYLRATGNYLGDKLIQENYHAADDYNFHCPG